MSSPGQPEYDPMDQSIGPEPRSGRGGSRTHGMRRGDQGFLGAVLLTVFLLPTFVIRVFALAVSAPS